MITINVYNGYNERFAPTGAKKAYLARITGRDSKMTFAREFSGRGDVLIDEPGLYEHRQTTTKGCADDNYYLIVERAGDLVRHRTNKETAMKVAKALDSGRAFGAIVDAAGKLVPPKQAEAAAVAKTIDAATDQCWLILQALSEKDAKKVLANLRQRATPPKEVGLDADADAPVGVVADAS